MTYPRFNNLRSQGLGALIPGNIQMSRARYYEGFQYGSIFNQRGGDGSGFSSYAKNTIKSMNTLTYILSGLALLGPFIPKIISAIGSLFKGKGARRNQHTDNTTNNTTNNTTDNTTNNVNTKEELSELSHSVKAYDKAKGADKETAKAHLESELFDVEQMRDKNNDAIAKAQATIDGAEKIIADNNEIVKTQGKIIERCRTAIAEANTAIAGANTDIAEANTDIAKFSIVPEKETPGAKTTREANLKTAQDKKTKAEANLKAAQDKKTQAETDAKAAQEKLDKAQAIVDKTPGEKKAAEEQKAQLEKANKKLNKEIEEAREALGEMDAPVISNEPIQPKQIFAIPSTPVDTKLQKVSFIKQTGANPDDWTKGQNGLSS